MDINRGIVADLDQALENEKQMIARAQDAVAIEKETNAPVRSPKPTVAVTGISGNALPTVIAAGGAYKGVSSVSSSRSLTPVRSQSLQPVDSDLPLFRAPLPKKTQAPGRAAAHLPPKQRTLTTYPVEFDPVSDKHLSNPYVGHCIYVEILTPSNLESHERDDPTWKGKYEVVLDEHGQIVTFRVLLDTGAPIDSWVYCTIGYDALIPLSKQNDFLPEHETLYNIKSGIPHPPEGHFNDEDNWTVLQYGIEETKSRMLVAQTVVKFQYDGRAPTWAKVTIPDTEFPIGAVCGVSPTDLERGEDGLLALGRQSNAVSAFKRSTGPRWKSKTLLTILHETRRISHPHFTIFTEHPLFVKSPKDCIIFGPLYNPGIPKIPVDESAWKAIPVVYNSGDWKVKLNTIKLVQTKAKRERAFSVESEVIIDNGASQTYLSKETTGKIDAALAPLGGMSPVFDPEDKVHLVFGTPDGGECTVVGEARRFFTSPYLQYSQPRASCTATTGKKYLLGLNFFMTFIVTFYDLPDPNGRIYLHAHSPEKKD